MNVLLLSQRLLVAVLLQCIDNVAGQLTAAPPTCPGGMMIFTCNVTGDRNGVTTWRVDGSECLLPHSTAGASSNCGPGSAFTARGVSGFGMPSATSFLSTLSGTATSALDDTLVECFGPVLASQPGSMVGNDTLQILGPPSAPTLSCVELTEDVSGTVNVTVNWTLSGGDSADFYLINITTNAPGLLNITTTTVTQHELTGFMTAYEYNITVRGINCGSEEGRESEPLTITTQVPAIPNSCNITSLSFNQSSERLLFIDVTWDSMPNPVNQGETCQGPSGNIRLYQLTFQTGSVVDTENVNIARCTAGRCSHTFEPPSNPPSSYDSVLVAAENVVGVGAARTCTTQPINTTNDNLASIVGGVSSPVDATLNCTFLPGFTGSAHCTVQYGTDPTYMNLPYSAESTETGTAGDSVSVVLRERLNSSTVYFYTVSAVSGDVTVVTRGNFTTPQYSCSLMELWNLSAPGVSFLPNVTTVLDDATQYPSCDNRTVGSAVLVNTTLNTATVAYYTGTTPGSVACFVCDESSGYEQQSTTTTTERVCQSNSTWSGSPITCVCTLSPRLLVWHIVLIGLGALFLVVGVAILVIIIIVCTCNPAWRKFCSIVIGVIFFVIATTLFVIGVALWCAIGLVAPNPPNDNACDKSWRFSRDTLIVAGFVDSSLVLILANILLLVLYCLGKKLSPLHVAAKRGDPEKVKKLVSEGEDVDIKDPGSGQTPLHIAAKHKHDYVVECLVKQLGADPNIQDNDGMTPLHLAAELTRIKMIDDLVSQVAENNTTDTGMTSTHVATPIKADINVQDKKGRTPLHVATEGKHKHTVERLVGHKADTNLQDNNGRTPLHVAVEKKRVDIVKCLKNGNADSTIEDKKGRTPLCVAGIKGYGDIIQLLREPDTCTHAQTKV